MTNAWDAEKYARCFNFVPEYGRALIDILAPQEGEKILDLGCGPGALTAEIAAKGCIMIGVDRDANMVALAKQTYPAIAFLRCDGDNLNLDTEFDAVFSNAALHWMKLDDVFPQVAKVLKKGGRFAAEMGGAGNIAAIEHAIYVAIEKLGLKPADFPTPWHFPTTAEAAQILERAGLEVRYTHLYDRATLLSEESGGVKGWVKMFGSAFMDKIPLAQHEQFLQFVEDGARPAIFKEGQWLADYRRFHFVAVKK